MLKSIALILLLGLGAGAFFSKLKLPRLIGMVLVGIALSPYALNLLDEKILYISGDIRKIALVIILTRAGLSLDVYDLKKVGRPAFLMCFIPACIEIGGTILLAPALLGISVLDAAIIGSIIAAVSPAVVVPRMITLMEDGYGTKKSVPQMILAGATVDDVFVIVVFTSLLSLSTTGVIDAMSFVKIPIAIILGIFLGLVVGFLLIKSFKKWSVRDTLKVLILISISFLFLEVERVLEPYVPISGLIAIMSMGIIIKQKDSTRAARLSVKYNKLWLGAEIFLFVLVGATVDLNYALAAGLPAVLLIFGALAFRMLGIFLSLIKTPLNLKERLFCMIAYSPKATVQAAIGAIPLSMGLGCGKLAVTLAVLSILITAPLGAAGIDHLHKKLLIKNH